MGKKNSGVWATKEQLARRLMTLRIEVHLQAFGLEPGAMKRLREGLDEALKALMPSEEPVAAASPAPPNGPVSKEGKRA
jgi:hypothetical protein